MLARFRAVKAKEAFEFRHAAGRARHRGLDLRARPWSHGHLHTGRGAAVRAVDCPLGLRMRRTERDHCVVCILGNDGQFVRAHGRAAHGYGVGMDFHARLGQRPTGCRLRQLDTTRQHQGQRGTGACGAGLKRERCTVAGSQIEVEDIGVAGCRECRSIQCCLVDIRRSGAGCIDADACLLWQGGTRTPIRMGVEADDAVAGRKEASRH